MKYLKTFENHSQYETYTADTTNFFKPNISLCIHENEVHFSQSTQIELTVKYLPDEEGDYDIYPTKLFDSESSFINDIESMKIDGVKQQEIVYEHIFGDENEHTVIYTLKDSVSGICNKAFYDCNRITEVVIPSRVTSVGKQSFYGCDILSNVTIPNSVVIIGGFAFNNTLWYESYSADTSHIYNNIIYINDVAYESIDYSATSVAFRAGTISITDWAFQGHTGLTSVVMPDSVISIGESSFSTCYSLSSCTIGNGVISIGDSAFYNCYKLTSINIPSGTTSIGENAFHGCYVISNITVDSNNSTYDSRNNCNAIIETSTNTLLLGSCNTIIPNTVRIIDDFAFFSRRCLTSITIPNGVISIGKQSFSYCSGLTSVEISDSVTFIDGSAFGDCKNLTSVTLGSGITSISDSVFYGCLTLTSITIPDSITTIGLNAFRNCNKLTSIDIPSGVTSIDNGAFYNCTGFTSVTIEATTPPTLGTNVFNNTNNCPIYVPSGSVDSYKAASGWSAYASRIRAIS